VSFADVDERVGNSVLSDSDYRSGIPSERGEICALIPSETFMPLKISQPSGQACLAPISDQDSLLFADGYDGAILGVAEFNGAASVVYVTAKIV
jgi:hypothetical protein